MNDRDRLLTEAMDTYSAYLLQLIYTYVRDWQTAEDLTQETFIRYYRSLAKFRGDASVKTFIYRIAVNVCHDYLASWKNKKIYVSELFQKLLKTNATPETELVHKDEQQQLVSAIEHLPTKYKDPLVLFHFAELSLEEVSQVLALPLNTVKTRLRRARQMLGVTLIEGGEVDA
ncbi:sigma-70 family RNA polymerase sigma factor [Solibacillus sp. CAU 1738]|uniref:sigma-70 family RNA polymerase sigma factor n=1 Tax=Solibacillus sp. CAU 1738 TaxID=3140363 RepID=UPI003261AF62